MIALVVDTSAHPRVAHPQAILMRLLRRGVRRKSSPNRHSTDWISQRARETQQNGWLRRFSLGLLWFLAGLVNPKRPRPNLGFGWADEEWEWSLPNISFIKASLQEMACTFYRWRATIKENKTRRKTNGSTAVYKSPNGDWLWKQCWNLTVLGWNAWSKGVRVRKEELAWMG